MAGNPEGVTYSGSLEGVRALLGSGMIGRKLMELAGKALDEAVRTAPRGDPDTDPHAGRYQDSFHAGLVYNPRYHRIEAKVWNDSPEAVFVEKGNVNIDAHHTLMRAVTSIRA